MIEETTRKSAIESDEAPLDGIPFIEETKSVSKAPGKPSWQAFDPSRKTLARTASMNQIEVISDSYFSTPNFIKRLCDLSEGLIAYMLDRGKQMEYLQRELKAINAKLPAAVYLPFVNESTRNYAVLHIVAEDAKIFKTKERCPLLLMIECYRPTEIALEKIPEIIKQKTQLIDENEAPDDLFNFKDVAKGRTLTVKSAQLKDNEFEQQREPALTIVTSATLKSNSSAGTKKSKEPKEEEEEYFLANDELPTKPTKEELKMTKELEKQKKVFDNVKKLSDKSEQSKEFGAFIDRRASSPITIGTKIEPKSPDYTPLKTDKDSRLMGMFKIRDDYFKG